MRKFLALLLSLSIVATTCLTGCSANSLPKSNKSETEDNLTGESSSDAVNQDSNGKMGEENITEDYIPTFSGLDDPDLLTYVENTVYTDLEHQFSNEDCIIENVSAVYISEEYINELTYNSKSNVFFGYTLNELDELFQGSRYIFTLGENGETSIQKMETFCDDSTEETIKNIAIGSGVILLCVTVSVVSGGVGAPAVSMIFAASAKTGASFALSTAVISGAAATITNAYQTQDIEYALKKGTLVASEGFKWGAIFGALIGGAKEVNALRSASKTVADTSNAVANSETIRSWRQSEEFALEKYGGKEQVTFLGGEEVPFGTPGGTRPDVVRTIDGQLEAIEVKNYTLTNASSRNELYSELQREISDRVVNLPTGATQRIALDVQGKGYSEELILSVKEEIWMRLESIYPNIPIDLI